ncbi:hypothetical protein [uncultured Muribaculum sp.]|uniref:hypothetical protein n=1 Tax=uncultured Muribaculum sp. TaxID=1918613 RepID=UPI0025B5AAEC|nr:hypothetical protein [uncultured Muribaculum sp.]
MGQIEKQTKSQLEPMCCVGAITVVVTVRNNAVTTTVYKARFGFCGVCKNKDLREIKNKLRDKYKETIEEQLRPGEKIIRATASVKTIECDTILGSELR